MFQFKTVLGMLLLFISIPIFASPTLPYNEIIFFGDSLTDNGNLYATDLHLLPKSPPYYHGQFSNGPTWADNIAAFFAKDHITTTNYAVGGETAYLHNPFAGFLPYSITASVNDYLLRNLFHDKSKTLFIILIGANDYLDGVDDIDNATTKVTASINSNIEKLINNDGRYFLILNLPDLAATPYVKEKSAHPEELSHLTQVHNQKLRDIINKLQTSHIHISFRLFDLYSLYEDLIQHSEVYNAKYQLNIQDTTTSCWAGGYLLHQMKPNTTIIAKQLTQQLQAKNISSSTSIASRTMQIDQLANRIAQSPDLLTAYEVSMNQASGMVPCNNPDEHVFWDKLHPTASVHTIFANTVIDYLLTVPTYPNKPINK